MNLVSEHRLRNHLAELPRLGPWLEDFCQRAQLDTVIRNALDLALVEWVTNVISYGWRDQKEHWVTIRFLAAGGEARVEVEDDGHAFNPLTLRPVDVTAPLETRGTGGLGVHMVRQLMDAVEYRHENGRNILTLIKRTPPAVLPLPSTGRGV